MKFKFKFIKNKPKLNGKFTIGKFYYLKKIPYSNILFKLVDDNNLIFYIDIDDKIFNSCFINLRENRIRKLEKLNEV